MNENYELSKDPWLAVNLSWLFPGGGQLYVKKYLRGVAFFILDILLIITTLTFFFSVKFSIFAALFVGLLRLLIIYGYGCIDAFLLAKKISYNKMKSESKKPWLAVFLSIIIPGLGHLYLRRWKFSFIYFSGFILIILVPLSPFIELAGEIILRVMASSHSFIIGHTDPTKKDKKILFRFVLFVLLIFVIKDLAYSYLLGKYLGVVFYKSLGKSMEPTLQNDDKVILSKIQYLLGKPKSGDIIIFKVNEDAKHDENALPSNLICKRIVAVGREEVKIINYEIYINSKLKNFYKFDNSMKNQKEKNNNSKQKITNKYLHYGVDSPYVVPEGYYFVLGDNLDYSIDSRYFGAIPENTIIGMVVKICWPPKRIGLLY